MTSNTVGLSWNRSTDAYTRLENLSGLTLAQSISYLNSVLPWSQMKRIQMLDDGTVTTRYGENCYDDSINGVAANGQAMWYLPAFWYYTNHTPGADNLYRWYISPTGAATDTVGGSAVTWKLHPAFIRNSVNKAWIALGAYEGYNNSGKLESKAGITPTVGTLANLRGYAAARGAGWGVFDYLTLCAIQITYLIEYGGFNAQALLGTGITNTTVQNTGLTTSNGNASYGATGDYTHAMSYRGLENVYGNAGHVIDGINIKGNYDPWIADHGFACDSFAAPYVDTGLTLPSSTNAFITDINVSSTYDYVFLPLAVGGNYLIKLCDSTYMSTGNRILGSYGYNGTDSCGMFELYCPSSTWGNDAARLMYIP